MRGESFIRMRVKLPGVCVLFNGKIELLGVEYLEPRAKPRKLARGKLFDGLLDVFGGGHSRIYSSWAAYGKELVRLRSPPTPDNSQFTVS
jgi:hypothetical protein